MNSDHPAADTPKPSDTTMYIVIYPDGTPSCTFEDLDYAYLAVSMSGGRVYCLTEVK